MVGALLVCDTAKLMIYKIVEHGVKELVGQYRQQLSSWLGQQESPALHVPDETRAFVEMSNLSFVEMLALDSTNTDQAFKNITEISHVCHW